jgi:hypothetical protein
MWQQLSKATQAGELGQEYAFLYRMPFKLEPFQA